MTRAFSLQGKPMTSHVPPELEDKFKSCKEKVMMSGMDEAGAYAVCYNSVVKADPEATKMAEEHGWDAAAYKAGARNSVKDLQRIRQIKNLNIEIGRHLMPAIENINAIIDLCEELGAAPMTPMQPEQNMEYNGEDMAGMAASAKAGSAIVADHALGRLTAVKAVGDWELDVLAVPFGTDSDGQTFDKNTDFMLGDFSQPAIIYHHGVNPGKGSIQDKPVIIGKTTMIEKRSDGIHIRVMLDKSLEWARRVWEAAKKGLAVASSDSIAHLARLEVNGKRQMYDKGRAGRIAVWPLAGVSLWDKVSGNFNPASRYALALPAMKAIYRDAGIPFPELSDSTNGDTPEAGEAERRAWAEKTLAKARQYLSKIHEEI